MKLKHRLVWLAVLVAVAALVFFCLPLCPGIIPAYNRYVFYPFQSFRGLLLGYIPCSMGDIIYVAAGIWLLVTVIRWVICLFHFRTHSQLLWLSLTRAAQVVLIGYLFFIAGWGANYYKQPLTTAWGLISQAPPLRADAEKAAQKKKTLANLITFNKFLAGKLNTYAPHFHTLSLNNINGRAKAYYGTYTDCNVKNYGLRIKPTLFGYFMERLGIDGYYNPFTGEGQVNKDLPAFTMPFVICHEMAHQAGIASEEDANLMAYALGTTAPDSTFRYSSYLNIFLYANNRLYRRDSAEARKCQALLNKLTLTHIDTLDMIIRRYSNQYAHYSNQLYDNYLKMQDQKDGIRSYGNVVSSAWLLEQKRADGKPFFIHIP